MIEAIRRYRNAVGYIRVSTELQWQNPQELERQAEKIRNFARQNNLHLKGICEDVGSAVRRHSFLTRPGLQDAAKIAEREHAVLVVTEPTRLFRNREAAQEFLDTYELQVASVDHGGILPKEVLLAAIERGSAAAARIRRGSKAAVRARQPGGHFLDAEIQRRAVRASVRSRKFKADEMVDALADLLRDKPELQEMTHRQLADYLNSRLMPTTRGNPWTKASIRRMRKLAMERIREREETERWLHEDEEREEPAVKVEDSGHGKRGVMVRAEDPQRVGWPASILRPLRQMVIMPLRRVLRAVAPRKRRDDTG